MVECVEIHGDKWKWSDIQEAIEWARFQVWHKRKWRLRPALVSKGSVADFKGQRYDPAHTKLVEDGWSHDHCEICWWTLHESEDPETGEGYTSDGHKWLCSECFSRFIARKV
jgi:hypothetical protein